ncbi:MAG: hypothetical protein E7361_00180 [Clostridiales bacterium]|nr:hypothetical protein [Clostridiales bacterium]
MENNINRLTANEYVLIEDILRYRCPENVVPLQEMQVAKVIALAEYYLGKNDMNNNIDKSEKDHFYYDTLRDTIYVRDGIFADEKRYAADMISLAHEVCHSADLKTVKDWKYIVEGAMFNANNQKKMVNLVGRVLRKKGIYKDIDTKKARFHENKVKDYFLTKYWDTNQERTARTFAMDFVGKIVDYWDSECTSIPEDSIEYKVMSRNAEAMRRELYISKLEERRKDIEIERFAESDNTYMKYAKAIQDYYTTSKNGEPSLLNKICQMNEDGFLELVKTDCNPLDDIFSTIKFLPRKEIAYTVAMEISQAKTVQREEHLIMLRDVMCCVGLDKDDDLINLVSDNIDRSRDRDGVTIDEG